MLREKEQIEQNLTAYRMLVKGGHRVYTWLFSERGELLNTDCPTVLPHLLLRDGELFAAVVEEMKQAQRPVFFESRFGLMWGAVSEELGETRVFHLIGPCPLRELPYGELEEYLHGRIAELGERNSFRRFLKELSVFPPILFHEYLLMLHFCIYDDALDVSDIVIHNELILPQGKKETDTDSYRTYLAEKAILRCVQNGDLSYQNAMSRSHTTTGGIQVSAGKSIDQAVISVMCFTSLCERAAIEGGLTPNAAFAVGDYYRQSLSGCKSLTDLGAITNRMIEDFVRRVKKNRENPACSRLIRECVDFIETHTDSDLSLRTLSERFGYTEYYLSRLFKKELGVSINQFIRAARIERAKILLETTDRSISDIAHELHFCSGNYFSDTFKAITGVSPSLYRKASDA